MPTILGACLGNCVHVAGIQNFLALAEKRGFTARFLGPAAGVQKVVDEAAAARPDILALSYRLTPETARRVFAELSTALASSSFPAPRMVFGGTPAVCAVAKEAGIFEAVFSGEEPLEAVEAVLGVRSQAAGAAQPPQTLRERVAAQQPYPLIRHHYGRPSLAETVEGAARIAQAGVLDILSVATDQNAQEFFFRPREMRPEFDGAGGVPVRKAEDLKDIYEATRCGNYPLVRCYSGTADLLKWAPMLLETIGNCWGATPLTWYSELDGRSDRTLEDAVRESQEVAAWWASRGVAVEINEPHQWALRNAHDALFVATGYIAALNAKDVGAADYVMQLMLNTPPLTSPRADLAKMTALIELVRHLESETFRVYRMVRTGLTSMPVDNAEARGHLGGSISWAMALRPHIVHVVGFSEADHAIRAEELIESCKIAHGAIRLALKGAPEVAGDAWTRARADHLKVGAERILRAIRTLGTEFDSKEALTDPAVIAAAVRRGVLDAPHHRGSRAARGAVRTAVVDGGYEVLDDAGRPVAEEDRLRALGL